MILHLSEEQLQLYTEQLELAGSEVLKHLQQCELCKVKAENYRQLFSSLSALASPAFDFDLAEMVRQQLSAPKQKIPWVAVAASLAGLVLIAFAAVLFIPRGVILVKGLPAICLAMLVAPVLVAVSIQALSYFSESHQKLQRLEAG